MSRAQIVFAGACIVEALIQHFRAIPGLTDKVDAGHEGQFFAQDLAGDGLVLDNERSDHAIHPYSDTRVSE